MIRLLILIFIFSICFYVFFQTSKAWFGNLSRRKNVLPPATKLTMFDVRELILRGEKVMAVEVYAKIFNVSYQEAAQAVEELAKSIEQRNTGF